MGSRQIARTPTSSITSLETYSVAEARALIAALDRNDAGAIVEASSISTGGAPTAPTDANTGPQGAPGWPGSFTGGTFNQGYPNQFIGASNTTYSYCDFTNEAWVGTPSWSTNITAVNVNFVGCRFAQSADVSNQGQNSLALLLLYADNVSFDYCEFRPSTANYPTPLAYGAAELSGDVTTYVQYGKGYQYALRGSGGSYTHCGKLTMDHGKVWGAGNALDLTNSTVAKPHVVKNSIFHHGADPFIVNQTADQFHNDCWLVDNGDYKGAQCYNTIMEIWGNTNCLAWQGSGVYDDALVQYSQFSGDQETVVISATGTSQRVTFTDNIFSTRIGRAVSTGKPLRSWSVSDSGTGSMWRRNKYKVAAGAAVGNYPGADWGNPSWNGQYWHPGDIDTTGGHAADYTG